MKIVQLRYFLSVCEHNSITAAAREWYVSQPAISAAVRELEDEYGIRLFLRNNNRLEITEKGKWFAERVRVLVDCVDDLDRDLRAMGEDEN